MVFFALDNLNSHIIKHSFLACSSNSGFKEVILASYFRTTVRNGYNTVLLDKIYVNLRILTYIKKWDVPCLVVQTLFFFTKLYLSVHF